MPYRMVPTPPKMSSKVKIDPARDKGWTSPNPTVKMVVTVMYSESSRPQPSISMKPTVPITTTAKIAPRTASSGLHLLSHSTARSAR